MAALKHHGTELLRLEMGSYRKAYMSDGAILRDCGGGWKKWGKVKSHINLADHIAKTKAFYENVTPDRYHRNAYRVHMITEFPCLETRVMVHATLEMLANDIDGVWSELEDRGAQQSLEDVRKLCELYEAACREGKEAMSAKAAQATLVPV